MTDYNLVMPFVVVHSHGGPWDDGSFVAGYEMGAIDTDPTLVPSEGRYIHTGNVPQADLIAMRHHLRCEVGRTTEDGQWTLIKFIHPVLPHSVADDMMRDKHGLPPRTETESPS